MPHFFRILLAVTAMAGFGLAIYSLASGRIALVLAFVPIGEVNRSNNPIWFWIFVVLFVFAGAASLTGLVMQKRKRG